MPQRVVADPEGGVPAKIEDHGTWVQGVYKMVAYVYGPGEVARADIDQATIAELRAKYWDSARRSLVIPFTGGRSFEFGAELLSENTDTTVVHVRPELSYSDPGPKPKECSCGKLSFRHAVEYHARNDRGE